MGRVGQLILPLVTAVCQKALQNCRLFCEDLLKEGEECELLCFTWADTWARKSKSTIAVMLQPLLDSLYLHYFYFFDNVLRHKRLKQLIPKKLIPKAKLRKRRLKHRMLREMYSIWVNMIVKECKGMAKYLILVSRTSPLSKQNISFTAAKASTHQKPEEVIMTS